jgi:hypothetical protein
VVLRRSGVDVGQQIVHVVLLAVRSGLQRLRRLRVQAAVLAKQFQCLLHRADAAAGRRQVAAGPLGGCPWVVVVRPGGTWSDAKLVIPNCEQSQSNGKCWGLGLTAGSSPAP